MGIGSYKEPVLEIPGQVDGQATLQSDRGDETQALFQYQWCAGVILLAAALAGENEYVAIWCEHHDDLLGELPDGRFHAVQVKTNASSNARWSCADRGFADAVKKFAEHEAAYSDKFDRYILFSNVKPYIPGRRPGQRSASPPAPSGCGTTAVLLAHAQKFRHRTKRRSMLWSRMPAHRRKWSSR